MTESIDKPESLLLKKWLLLEPLGINRNLTAGDALVFWLILDYYNPKLGYSYPSFNKLALRTGFSKRNIVNSVNRLVKHGFVEIILHGSQNNIANRYKPNFKLLNDWLEWRENNPNSDLGVWKHSSIGNNSGVWNASSQPMEAQFQRYGSTVPPNPSINPSINEGLIGGLEDKSSSAASLASPLTGSPLASKDKYKYPDFWNVYPMRKNVGKAEDEITTMLSNGVLLADIVEGARQYAEYIKVQQATWKGGKDYTTHPQNFVKNRNWLDDFTITPKAEVKPKVVKVENIVFDKAEFDKALWMFYNHQETCIGGCLPYGASGYSRYSNPIYHTKFLYNFCEIGKPLYYEYKRLDALKRGVKSKNIVTKEELIKANHLLRLYEDEWELANPNKDIDDMDVDEKWSRLSLTLDNLEYNAYYLFK